MNILRFAAWLVVHADPAVVGLLVLVWLASMFGGAAPTTWAARAIIVGPVWLYVLYEMWELDA